VHPFSALAELLVCVCWYELLGKRKGPKPPPAKGLLERTKKSRLSVVTESASGNDTYFVSNFCRAVTCKKKFYIFTQHIGASFWLPVSD